MVKHIDAQPSDIAETVLLPGDPLRAKGIADKFFDDATCYNEVRGMYGYTGTYNGNRVSVQGTGMGMPTTSIYVHELIELGAKRLIRVGTCGAYQSDLNIGDVILAMTASTDSSINQHIFDHKDYAPTASFNLLKKATDYAQSAGLNVSVGNILSSDSFYNANGDHWKKWAEYGVLGVEMETSAIYTLAARHNVEALSILTVSDSLITGEQASVEERQHRFDDMVKIALQLV
ncbi:MAG: purine-nucleoside phosphorylase [Bacteroidota bacterium]